MQNLNDIERFSLLSEPFSEPTNDGVHIRPVHIEHSTTPSMPAGLIKILLQNANLPIFSVKACDWIQFREEWEYYMAKVSAAYHIPESTKVELLENCLDEVNRRKMRLDRKNGRLVFSEVFSKLEVKYGQDQDLWLRKNGRKLPFPIPEKLGFWNGKSFG